MGLQMEQAALAVILFFQLSHQRGEVVVAAIITEEVGEALAVIEILQRQRQMVPMQ